MLLEIKVDVCDRERKKKKTDTFRFIRLPTGSFICRFIQSWILIFSQSSPVS